MASSSQADPTSPITDSSSSSISNSPEYRAPFDSAEADVVLSSIEGTLYRVPSFTLRNTCGMFRSMFSTGTNIAAPIPIDVKDVVLDRILRMVSGLKASRLETYEDVEDLANLAERWDAPGPLGAIRASITAPSFLEEPLKLYAVATRFGWEEEAKLASKYTLRLSLYDEEHHETLQRLRSIDLLNLLNLHRRRRDMFKRKIDSEEEFDLGNSSLPHCACGQEIDNHTWRELKMAMFLEMDRRPMGDVLCSVDMEEWPETIVCWAAKCKCGRRNYNKVNTLRDIKGCLEALPTTI